MMEYRPNQNVTLPALTFKPEESDDEVSSHKNDTTTTDNNNREVTFTKSKGIKIRCQESKQPCSPKSDNSVSESIKIPGICDGSSDSNFSSTMFYKDSCSDSTCNKTVTSDSNKCGESLSDVLVNWRGTTDQKQINEHSTTFRKIEETSAKSSKVDTVKVKDTAFIADKNEPKYFKTLKKCRALQKALCPNSNSLKLLSESYNYSDESDEN